MINTIFLDMDGVIADFDKHYSSIYGVNCRDDEKKSIHWAEFVSNYGFFDLPFTKDAERLLDVVLKSDYNVEILSCINDQDDSANVAMQKRLWLSKMGLGRLNYNFVRTKQEKSIYADRDALLIDDSIACIEPFRDAGGWAIHHISIESTIGELECFLAKVK